MEKTMQLLFLAFALIFVTSCDDDDVSPYTNPNVVEERVELLGAQQVPPVASQGQGSFDYSINNQGELQYTLSAQNTNSNIIFAHIHVAECGENGSVVANLFGPFTPDGVEANGELTSGRLTDADLTGPLAGMTIADLREIIDRGEAYVNVHSVSDPSGELRGQLGNIDCN